MVREEQARSRSISPAHLLLCVLPAWAVPAAPRPASPASRTGPVIVFADGGFLTRLLLHEENLGVFLGCSGHLTHQLVLFSTNERLEARLSLNCLQSSLPCFIHIQALASIIPISEWKLWRADSCRSPAPPGRSHCIDTNSLPRHVGIGNLVLNLTKPPRY